jgi:hypothetical protein
MSETPERDTTIANHGITAEDRLSAPDDIGNLQRRQLELTKLLRPLHAHRAELHALLTLTINGTISAGEVWETLRSYYGAGGVKIDTPQAKTSKPLTPLHRDLEAVWNNLQRLCNGEVVFEPLAPVPGAPDSVDSDDPATFERWMDWRNAQTREWFRQIMESAGALLDSYGNVSLSTSMVVSDVPRQLQREITKRHDIAWRDSPYSLGASIEALPGIMHDYYGRDSSVGLMEIWANSVRWALDACDTVHDDQDQHSKAISWFSWFWMLFKGYAYQSLDSGLAGALYNHPELLSLVRDTLLLGDYEYRQLRGMSTIEWTGHGGKISNMVAEMSVETLIERIDLKVEQARADAEALNLLR